MSGDGRSEFNSLDKPFHQNRPSIIARWRCNLRMKLGLLFRTHCCPSSFKYHFPSSVWRTNLSISTCSGLRWASVSSDSETEKIEPTVVLDPSVELCSRTPAFISEDTAGCSIGSLIVRALARKNSRKTAFSDTSNLFRCSRICCLSHRPA